MESGPLGNAGNLDVEMYLRVSQYGKALVNSYTRGPSMGEQWSTYIIRASKLVYTVLLQVY